MTTIALLVPPRASAKFAREISAAWGRAVGAIVQCGAKLIEAKAALAHGAFLEMVRADLPFGERTAQALMAIARHEVLASPKHVSLLPASWGTLCVLARLSPEDAERLLGSGQIRAEMTRAAAEALVARVCGVPPIALEEGSAPESGAEAALREDLARVFRVGGRKLHESAPIVADVVRLVPEEPLFEARAPRPPVELAGESTVVAPDVAAKRARLARLVDALPDALLDHAIHAIERVASAEEATADAP